MLETLVGRATVPGSLELKGKTPLPTVNSAERVAGRQKVIDWLKQLENRSVRHDDGPIAEYDLGWMWAELGLQGQRKSRESVPLPIIIDPQPPVGTVATPQHGVTRPDSPTCLSDADRQCR